MDKSYLVRDVAALWKSDKRQYVKQSTMSVYTLALEKHILPVFGEKQRFMESDIQDFVFHKIQEGLSQKTIKDLLIVAKMIQRFGYRCGMLPMTDWKVKFPADFRKNEMRVLSIAEQRRLMNYLKANFTFRNLGIYICLSTGLRIGEVCALKWGDIDLKAETISVNRTLERVYVIDGTNRFTKLIIGAPKTLNSVRDVPMSCELLKLIRPFKKIMNEEYFILTNDAKPTEPRTYRNYYKQVLNHLSIPDIKFHSLRHSFATRCIESQCDYKTVSSILGHANIRTTLDLYVHPNMDQKKRCVSKMFKSLQ